MSHKLLILTVLLLACMSCTQDPYYSFPQRDFGLAIPRTIEHLYNIDTVKCGFGGCVEKVLALRINPVEFQQYLGHLDFQDIKNEDLHTTNGMVMLDIVQEFKYSSKTVTATTRLHEQNLHYPFSFEQGKIHLFRGINNRVILYSLGQSVFDLLC